jgi:hypothetical protein
VTKQPDASVAVTGNNGQTVIALTADTDLTDVTGLRLEMIGPGRAPDGNFVLNEIQVSAGPKGDPKASKPVALQNPKADFMQQGFDIARTIDGRADRNTGWAVSPATGVTHWATYEAKEPFGKPGGTRVTVKLIHRFQNTYLPGRFRLSVTTLKRPLGLDLAEDYRSVLAVAPELRTQAQRDALTTYFRAIDPEWRNKVNAVNLAKAPLPADPTLQQLRGRLAEAQKPVGPEPRLVQLRADIEMSIKQAATRRLTAAQDVAWALINSPAFLFNH